MEVGFSDVHGVTMSGCDYAGENGGYFGSDFGGVIAIGTDFAGFNFGGSVGSPLGGANLTQANLSGANLEGSTLEGATLTQADLIGADLTGINASGADFTGANLSGAQLTSTNFTGAVLTNATLTNADISKSNFTGATLSGVVSSGLTGTPASLPAGWTVKNGILTQGAAVHSVSVTVTFSAKSSALTSAMKTSLARYSKELTPRESVTITGWAKGNASLARARAAVVSRYLTSLVALHVTVKAVTSSSANKAVVQSAG